MNLQTLEDKPLFSMTGKEFLLLLKDIDINDISNSFIPIRGKNYVYGIKGIASLLGCSTSSVTRIKKSGILDKAIIQNGRKIIVDSELALELYDNSKNNKRKA